MGYELPVALILCLILAGVAPGDATFNLRFIYRSDQSVIGDGFYSSYQNITAGNLHLANLGYGSGSYSYEARLSALREANNRTSGEFYGTSERSISFRETVDQVYGPVEFNLGGSFKSGPIRILGKEETILENSEDGSKGVSMNALFDSASVLSKDISADLYWKSVEGGYINDPNEDYSKEQRGTTKMNVDATFTGRGHVGALEIARGNHSLDKNINILVDEDYFGTFSISKKMSHEFTYRKVQTGEGWLPCCNGGWFDMKATDRKGYGASAKGVFDCTCYKVHDAAQFKEPDENKIW